MAILNLARQCWRSKPCTETKMKMLGACNGFRQCKQLWIANVKLNVKMHNFLETNYYKWAKLFYKCEKTKLKLRKWFHFSTQKARRRMKPLFSAYSSFTWRQTTTTREPNIVFIITTQFILMPNYGHLCVWVSMFHGAGTLQNIVSFQFFAMWLHKWEQGWRYHDFFFVSILCVFFGFRWWCY